MGHKLSSGLDDQSRAEGQGMLHISSGSSNVNKCLPLFLQKYLGSLLANARLQKILLADSI